jgi:hypothetical protein
MINMLPSSDVIHLLLVSDYGISVKKLLDRISNLSMYFDTKIYLRIMRVIL